MSKVIESILDFLEVTDFSNEKKALAILGIKYTRSQYNNYLERCRSDYSTPLLFFKTQEEILKPLKNKTNKISVKKGFGFIEINTILAEPRIIEKLNENYKMVAQKQRMSVYPEAHGVICRSIEYKSIKNTTLEILACPKEMALA